MYISQSSRRLVYSPTTALTVSSFKRCKLLIVRGGVLENRRVYSMDSVDIDFFNHDFLFSTCTPACMYMLPMLPWHWTCRVEENYIVQNEVRFWIRHKNIKSKECDTGCRLLSLQNSSKENLRTVLCHSLWSIILPQCLDTALIWRKRCALHLRLSFWTITCQHKNCDLLAKKYYTMGVLMIGRSLCGSEVNISTSAPTMLHKFL